MTRAARTAKSRPAPAAVVQLDLIELLEQMERQDAERARTIADLRRTITDLRGKLAAPQSNS